MIPTFESFSYDTIPNDSISDIDCTFLSLSENEAKISFELEDLNLSTGSGKEGERKKGKNKERVYWRAPFKAFEIKNEFF